MLSIAGKTDLLVILLRIPSTGPLVIHPRIESRTFVPSVIVYMGSVKMTRTLSFDFVPGMARPSYQVLPFVTRTVMESMLSILGKN